MTLEGVTLMGALDKTGVRRLLYEADALVLPSRSEVQPLVVLEAMSTGIPVVATACVPQNERLEGASSIVPTDDAKALAEAMHALVLGYDGYDGRKIAEQVRELASPDVVGRKLSELLTQAKG